MNHVAAAQHTLAVYGTEEPCVTSEDVCRFFVCQFLNVHHHSGSKGKGPRRLAIV